jgi:uncharacterized membrane protein YeiH
MMDAGLALSLLDHAGVFAFALSGGLTAVRHRLDIFGVIVIALLTAVGGGTLRDLLLDQPVFWLDDQVSLLLAAGAGIAAFLAPGFWSRLRSLVWIDAVGLSLFTVVGASKALQLDHGFLVVVIMGTMTATAGGLIRDVVCNETPLLLRQDVYATAALAGAATFWACSIGGAGEPAGLAAGALTAFAIRAAAIRFRISLPQSTPGPD